MRRSAAATNAGTRDRSQVAQETVKSDP